jgi:hypothetical protein
MTATRNATPVATRPLAVAFLSGGSLLLEIALTRLFSTLFYPPAVFAILSLAVFGIGLGAALATWRRSLRRPEQAGNYIALAALATVVLVLWAALAPATFGSSPAGQIPLFLLAVLPYVGVGLGLATLFGNAAAASPRLYRADLIGAGLGTLIAVPALNLGGGVSAVLLAALLLALAGVIAAWGLERRRLMLSLFAGLLSLSFLGTNVTGEWLHPPMTALPAEKPIATALREGELLRTEWDAFARTDLVAPGNGGPYQLYVDGAAASIMPPVVENDFLWRDIGLFPFATAQPERVFVIGPGGGLDVWFGLQSEAAEIVAVEVNPASVEMVEAMSAYNGDLYGRPEVRVLVDEGRSVLRREGRSYDLIFLSQLVTLSAERSGYALVENTTFTVEAFGDYLDHLNPGGQIALKLYDEPTLSRALSTILAAWRQRGLSDAAALERVLVLLDRNGEEPVPLLLARNEPFGRDEALSLGSVARDVGFSPLFLPGLLARPPLDAVASGEIPFDEVVADADIDLSPTSDNRPFFYQFERGIPTSLQPLLWGVAAVIVAGGLLLFWRQRQTQPATLRWAPLYFASLGMGFIAVEVAIIQQTRLFLGHPTLAVTVVLAVLLIGGGLGSGLAGRRPAGGGVSLAFWPTAAVALLGLLWLALWPLLSQTFLAAALPLRVAVVAVSLLPLSLFLGMPFPLALRAVGRAGSRHVAMAWAVNGVMTVAGSVLGVTIALLAGFNAVLLLGSAAYVVATLLALVLQPAVNSVPETAAVPGS